MTQRIAWLGPWNRNSSIAEMGMRVINELAGRGHSVDIFRTEVGEMASQPGLPTRCSVRLLRDISPIELHRSHDAVLANIGDSFAMHGALLPFLMEIPALLIIHDLFLANLATGWAAMHPNGDALLREVVRLTYGNIWPSTTSFWTDLSDMVMKRPLVEYFASLGYGAVVHAAHYEERVRSACLGPVISLPLPAYIPAGVAAPRPIEDKLEILTIGHVNRNKRAADILVALASSATLRRSCRYRLVGPVEDHIRRELIELAERLGVQPPEFTGRVSDSDLRKYISGADVLACLRNPVLEGSSGSMVVALASERPTLVSNQGCYKEIPDNIALKCTPGDEATDSAAYLEWIVINPQAAAEMGKNAARYVRSRHSPKRYVDGLLRLIEKAMPNLPGVLASINIGRELHALGVGPDDPAVARAAQGLRDLLAMRCPASAPMRQER